MIATKPLAKSADGILSSSPAASKKHPQEASSSTAGATSDSVPVAPAVTVPVIHPTPADQESIPAQASQLPIAKPPAVDKQVAPVSTPSVNPARAGIVSMALSEESDKRPQDIDKATALSTNDIAAPAAVQATSATVIAAAPAVPSIAAIPHNAEMPVAGVLSNPSPSHVASPPAAPSNPSPSVTESIYASTSYASTSASVVTDPSLPQTITSTSNVLEVGIASGSHGWLRVRAEIQPDSGDVVASVVANTSASVQSLHQQLPSLNAYLASEHVQVASVVIDRAAASQPAPDAGLSASTGGANHGSPQDHPQHAPTDANQDRSEWNDSATRESALPATLLSPEVIPSAAGGWISVRA